MFFLVLLLAGCAKSKDVEKIKVNKVLTGYSKNWKVVCVGKGYLQFEKDNGRLNIDSSGDYKLDIIYKGSLEEINDMRSISIETPWMKSKEITSSAPYSKMFRYQGEIAAKTILSISKGEGIKITIIWDGDKGGSEVIVIK